MRTSSRLEQLTGLRFFAAMLVFLSHLDYLRTTDNPLQGLAATVFHEGYCGVTFFYVLSGFILSHTYGQELSVRLISRQRYLLLRIVRIFPLHLIIALPLAFALLLRAGADALPTVVLNLTLLQSWSSDKLNYFSLNSVSWSLSDELFFYTAFIWLVALRSRTLLALAVVWASAATAYVFTLGQEPPPDAGHWVLYVLPTTRLLDFIAGMLLHRMFRRGAADGDQAVEPSAAWTVLEAAAVATLFAAMYAFPHFGLAQAWRYELAYLPIMMVIVHVFTRGRGRLSRALITPKAVFLGNASFALYMIHQPMAARIAAHGGHAIHGPLLLAGLTILLCTGAAALVYHYLEHPMHKWLRQKIDAAPAGLARAAKAR